MMVMLANEDVDVDDEDVKFVLAQCDDDGNGAISRDELLPMVAVWSQMVNEKPKRSSKAESETAEESTPREAPIPEESSAQAPGAAASASTASDEKAGSGSAEPKPNSKGSSACVIL